MVVAILGEFIDTEPTISSPLYFAKKMGKQRQPQNVLLETQL